MVTAQQSSPLIHLRLPLAHASGPRDLANSFVSHWAVDKSLNLWHLRGKHDALSWGIFHVHLHNYIWIKLIAWGHQVLSTARFCRKQTAPQILYCLWYILIASLHSYASHCPTRARQHDPEIKTYTPYSLNLAQANELSVSVTSFLLSFRQHSCLPRQVWMYRAREEKSKKTTVQKQGKGGEDSKIWKNHDKKNHHNKEQTLFWEINCSTIQILFCMTFLWFGVASEMGVGRRGEKRRIKNGSFSRLRAGQDFAERPLQEEVQKERGRDKRRKKWGEGLGIQQATFLDKYKWDSLGVVQVTGCGVPQSESFLISSQVLFCPLVGLQSLYSVYILRQLRLPSH